MARKLTSQRRREKITQLEDELTEEREEEVAPLIEDALSKTAPPPTQEQLIATMNLKKLKRKKNQEEKRNYYQPERPLKPRTSLMRMEEGPIKVAAIRAAAQAALLMGQPPNLVASQYGLNQAAVEEWKDIVGYTQAIHRRDRLNDMLMAFIEQEFKSLMAISIVTSNEEWIMQQTAADLADYVAVKADRVLALLAAFGRSKEAVRQISDQLESIE